MSKQKYPRADDHAKHAAADIAARGVQAVASQRLRDHLADHEPAPEPTRCAWALWPAKGGGFAWCRVLLPVSVVERYRSGPEYVPDQKGIALAKIEVDMASESVTTRRGWT